MTSSPDKYPGQGHPAHPEIFDLRAMPAQPSQLKPGQLPEHKIKQFFEKGYLVVEDFFADDELNPCLRAIESIVDRVARNIHEAGHIIDLHEDKDVFTRLTCLDKEFPGATILAHKDGTLPIEFQVTITHTHTHTQQFMFFLTQMFVTVSTI